MGTQQPTCTNLRIRSTADANIVFHAVQMRILPMVNRRLDAADRNALAAGHVYVWEERGPDSDATGVGMERFTEGRHWHASRIRDDFLIYVEKDTTIDPTAHESQIFGQSPRPIASTSTWDPQILFSSRYYRPKRPLIKQTYSAWVTTPNGRRKWHMNAYYTEESLNALRSVDDIPSLASLVVPPSQYQKARQSKGDRPRPGRQTSAEQDVTHSVSDNSSRGFSPYPSHTPQSPRSPSDLRPSYQAQTQPLSPPSSPLGHAVPHEPASDPGSPSSYASLIPLNYLRGSAMIRRDRADDEVLKRFRIP